MEPIVYVQRDCRGSQKILQSIIDFGATDVAIVDVDEADQLPDFLQGTPTLLIPNSRQQYDVFAGTGALNLIDSLKQHAEVTATKQVSNNQPQKQSSQSSIMQQIDERKEKSKNQITEDDIEKLLQQRKQQMPQGVQF